MLLTEESSSKPPYACLSDPLTMRANIELCSSSRAQTKRLHPLNAPFSIPRPSCFFCSTAEQLGRIIELARYREIETSEFLPSTVNYVNTRYKTWENENRLNGQRTDSSTVKEKRIWFDSVCFDLIIMMVRRDSVRNFTADFYWSETVKRPIFIPQTHTHTRTYIYKKTYILKRILFFTLLYVYNLRIFSTRSPTKNTNHVRLRRHQRQARYSRIFQDIIYSIKLGSPPCIYEHVCNTCTRNSNKWRSNSTK